jgi:hypothetical protein
MGVWVGTEIGIKDPGTFLIAPLVLGVAAPASVYLLNRPRMGEGMPAAITSGLVTGAGEGIGIATYQMATSEEGKRWGFKGLARATAIGATVGAVGGAAVGYWLKPPPASSAVTTSGIVWGTAVGSMVGLGASGEDAKKGAALGGLIGYNVGLGALAGLATVAVPSWYQLSWMWAGSGIGAAVSLPIFLFYMGKDTPPAKRGFIFMGATTTIGLAAGALFSGTFSTVAVRDRSTTVVRREAPGFSIDAVAPLVSADGGGVLVGGRWQ